MQAKSSDNNLQVNLPLAQDKLTLGLLVSNLPDNDSKVVYQGYLCLRDWFDENKEDQWCFYWAVIRTGHLFLFRNAEPTTVCQRTHLLCQYYLGPMEKRFKWPKGMLYCRLLARNDNTVCSQESGGDMELGWCNLYNWERHLRSSVGFPEGKSAGLDDSARQRKVELVQAHRRLLVTLRRVADSYEAAGSATGSGVNESFNGGSDCPDDEACNSLEMPMPRKAKTNLFGNIIKQKSNPYDDSLSDSISNRRQQPQQQQPQAIAANNSEEDIYDDASDSGAFVVQPVEAAAEAEAEDAVYEDPTEMRSEPAATAEVEAEYLTPDEPQLPQPRRPQLPQLPQLPAKPLPNPKPNFSTAAAAAATGGTCASGMAGIVASCEPVEISVKYFDKAYQNPPGQTAEAASNLSGKPPGTFSVVGFVSHKPRKVFALLVQTGRRVATYNVCEQHSGYRVMPSQMSHPTMNQLLYHHHIFDLPTSNINPEAGVRLTQPVDGDGTVSFHCASAWTLTDRSLCQTLLTGTDNGTFAVVNAPDRKLMFVYASQQGQVVKLALESRANQIWAEPHVKFQSLEELLVHYHEKELPVTLVGSQKSIDLQLVTPCQLSEQVANNINRYLSQESEEVRKEQPGVGGTVFVETRQLGPVTVRNETSTDMSLDPVPILLVQLANNGVYKGPIDVTTSEFRCFDDVYTVRRNPEMQFDSMEKLLLYVSSHSDKLH